MGCVFVYVRCLLFVGLGGIAFGENWDIDYNRLEILQTDSQSAMSPQKIFARNRHHNSRRSYRQYDRNGGARAYANEKVALRDRTNHQNNKSTRMIYKSREDPSLFYKRNISPNLRRHNKDAKEYAHQESTLVHRKYHTIPQSKQNYDITNNSIYKPREDPGLFYKRNDSYYRHRRDKDVKEYAEGVSTLVHRKYHTTPQNNQDYNIKTNSISKPRDDSIIYYERNNRPDSEKDTWPSAKFHSNDLAILGSQYTIRKPPRRFRQTGRALVRSGETIHIGPDPHMQEDIGYNVPKDKLSPTIHNISEYQRVNSINGDKFHHKKVQNDRQTYPDTMNKEIITPCIRCPYERTVVGKIGQDKVMLLKPKLMTCDGRDPGPAVDFKRMYGPHFGKLLTEGSHVIVASVTHHGDEMQLCQFRVRVVLQRCPAPRAASVRCDAPATRDVPSGAWCYFACRDATKHMVGSSALVCGEDLQWEGTPPHCKEKTWCYRPVEPQHGRLVCSGRALANVALAHASRCRARCGHGLRSRPALAVCRRGEWSATLACEPAT